MSGIFNSAIFNNAIFNTGAVAPPDTTQADQPSNWQADYWKRRSKKEREEDELRQRIELGILPPEEREIATAAVVEADQAARQLAAGEIDAPEALLAGMEARLTFEDAYRRVYKEAYIAAVVAEHWRENMRKITRRRKAIALLLH